MVGIHHMSDAEYEAYFKGYYSKHNKQTLLSLSEELSSKELGVQLSSTSLYRSFELNVKLFKWSGAGEEFSHHLYAFTQIKFEVGNNILRILKKDKKNSIYEEFVNYEMFTDFKNPEDELNLHSMTRCWSTVEQEIVKYGLFLVRLYPQLSTSSDQVTLLQYTNTHKFYSALYEEYK